MFCSGRFFCWMVISTLLLEKVWCQAKDEDKWSSIKCRIRSPCCPLETCDYKNCTKPVLLTNVISSRIGRISKATLCLDLDSLVETVKEALDIDKSLLENNSVRRWGTGKWTLSADKMACDMKSCVQLKVPRKTDKNQTKLVRDMLQIVSFADYIHKASKYWDAGVQSDLKVLEKRMMNIACKMAVGLSSSTHSYVVTTDDFSNVPSDLLNPNGKGTGRVATYVVLQKVEDFLKRLVDSYNRSRIACSSKKQIV